MRRRAGLNETLFDRSNSPLVALIIRTSEEDSSGRSHPLSNALIEQIVDLRAARLQREMIARGGVSTAQWLRHDSHSARRNDHDCCCSQPQTWSANQHVERLCRRSIGSVLRPARARSTVRRIPRSRADSHRAGDRTNRTVIHGPLGERWLATVPPLNRCRCRARVAASHSTTWSARSRKASGIFIPIALAVFRLITSL
jgi:hypothetical protein